MVFDLAFALIAKNATFSDAMCADATSDSVAVSNEVTVPLVIAAAYVISVHECADARAACYCGVVPKDARSASRHT